MTKSGPVVFFGTEDFSVASLVALLEAGVEIAAVITKPDARAGRGRQLQSPKVKQLALKHGLKVFQPNDLAEIAENIKELSVTHGVLVAYGKIIPEDFIDLFSGGIINLHPSLLPKYRGPSPIEAAILNGDGSTGLSLMRLTPMMDAGPIYDKKEVRLTGTENRLLLYEKLAQEGSAFLVDKLEAILSGQIEPVEQPSTGVSYTKLLTKADGIIDWSKAAPVIEREVRAYLGFPKSQVKLKQFDVIITKARVASGPDDGSLVQKCGEGWLEIQRLITPTGKLTSGEEFLRGYERV